MKLSEVVRIVEAKTLCLSDENALETSIYYAFATDLMSDALALIHSNFESTIILTGLCNVQALRTAEMLDIKNIVFVRGKMPDENTIEEAKRLKMNLFTTPNLMYESCGLLFKEGLEACL